MARELTPRLVAQLALALVLPGCSLLLDFSDSAAPHDAPADVPYTSAECAYDEPNNTFAEAVAIVPGTDTGPAAICQASPPDEDWYKFSFPMGATTATVATQFTSSVGDLDLDLYDATGSLVAKSFGFGDGETITCPGTMPACPALTPGDYVFRVYPATQTEVNHYTFSVAIQ